MSRWFMLVAFTAACTFYFEVAQGLKKFSGKYDNFASFETFKQETAELANLFSVTSSICYPLPVYGYLYYYVDKWQSDQYGDSSKIVDLDEFFTHYHITHVGGLLSESSSAKKGVESLVTYEVLDWLYREPQGGPLSDWSKPLLPANWAISSKGKKRVNAYLDLVARALLTLGKDVYNFSGYEKLPQPDAKELLVLVDDPICIVPLIYNDTLTNTLFSSLGINEVVFLNHWAEGIVTSLGDYAVSDKQNRQQKEALVRVWADLFRVVVDGVQKAQNSGFSLLSPRPPFINEVQGAFICYQKVREFLVDMDSFLSDLGAGSLFYTPELLDLAVHDYKVRIDLLVQPAPPYFYIVKERLKSYLVEKVQPYRGQTELSLDIENDLKALARALAALS